MADPAYGRSSSQWRRLRAIVKSRLLPCCRCGQPIDYSRPYRDPATGKVDPLSFSVDHYPHRFADRPDLGEDLANLAAAHLHCNQSAWRNQQGVTSHAW